MEEFDGTNPDAVIAMVRWAADHRRRTIAQATIAGCRWGYVPLVDDPEREERAESGLQPGGTERRRPRLVLGLFVGVALLALGGAGGYLAGERVEPVPGATVVVANAYDNGSICVMYDGRAWTGTAPDASLVPGAVEGSFTGTSATTATFTPNGAAVPRAFVLTRTEPADHEPWISEVVCAIQ